MLNVIYYLLVFTRWINVYTLHSLMAPVRNVNIIIIVIVYESVLFSHDISGKYYNRVTNLMASRNVFFFISQTFNSYNTSFLRILQF
jgi:hypothetical protein